jgi:hypothetical protein
MTLDDLIGRADELIQLGEHALAGARRGDFGTSVDSSIFTQLRAASLSFIEKVFGRSQSYYSEFDEKVVDSTDYYVKYALGILRAIKAELVGGWLVTTRGIISSEVFADFLEMSGHLLDEKYKDPAAVMIGSVLEEHLRQLSDKVGIPREQAVNGRNVPRKADSLNADLVKAGTYGVLDQKSVTAWLDLRNKAAHGRYSEYTPEQVGLMLDGVRNFIARVPL